MDRHSLIMSLSFSNRKSLKFDHFMKMTLIWHFRVQEMENILEHQENESGDIDKELEDQLAADLNVVKAELDLCTDCWEESLNRINKATNVTKSGTFIIFKLNICKAVASYQ